MKHNLFLFCCALTLCSLGCNSPQSDRPGLGNVSGMVTLDGKPAAKAVVTFIPAVGRPSSGICDADGRYQLTYMGDQQGAAVGEHEVRITTLDESQEGVISSTPFKEIFPAKYNSKSELVAVVKEGDNSVNFELKSK